MSIKKTTILFSAAFVLILGKVQAQKTADTLHVTLVAAEQRFLEKNALLLAQKFNIEATKAQIIQAGLWVNPMLTVEQMLYNSKTGRVLPILGSADDSGDASTQQAVQVQQLFLLAKKRPKQVNIAKINTEIAEYGYFDMLRGLAADLRSAFSDLYFLQENIRMYGEQIAKIQGLIEVYKEQVALKNIALKEVVRLQSLLFALEQERSSAKREAIEKQRILKVLMSDNSPSAIVVEVNKDNIEKLSVNQLTIGQLLEIADANRYDLKAQEATVRLSEANISLQKALKTPDLTVGYLFDRAGSSVPRYHAVTFNIGLPFFNKNQGNIKTAEMEAERSRKYVDAGRMALENDILQGYRKAQEADNSFRNIDKSFLTNYTTLLEGVVSSYQKRNISQVEFLDFLESYKQTIVQINSLQRDRVRAFEELNFAVGKRVFGY